jgi:hypothetical protein
MLFLSLLLGPPAAARAEPPAAAPEEACGPVGNCDSAVDFEGRWEGVMTFSPAQLELDFTLDLFHGSGGQWIGRIVVPTMDWDFPLEQVKADGAKLTFEYKTGKGAATFSGTLADGTIRGDCVLPMRTAHNGPFTMSRPGKEEAAKPALEVLAGGMKDLAARFNEDRNKVRVVLLLSPT